MTTRNRVNATITELRDLHGVSVALTRDGSLFLTALDSRGDGEDATRLAKMFKWQISEELKRKVLTCKNSA